jgi:hypothetical protein
MVNLSKSYPQENLINFDHLAANRSALGLAPSNFSWRDKDV